MAANQDTSPNLIMELTHAVERTEMLYNAAELRIFDVLARQDTPMSADDIARCLSVPQKSVHQLDCLLNICSNLGLLVKRQANDGQNIYENTRDTSTYLSHDSDMSLMPLIAAARHQFNFSELIKEGSHDESRRWFFDTKENEKAFQTIPHRFRRYCNKQDGYSKTGVHLLKAFDLTQYKTVVDLGGGLGTVSRMFKEYYPEAEVTCVDMPRVVEMARDLDTKEKRPETIKYAAVDIFSEEPLPKADLYIMGHLLHMFDDETCDVVLNRVQEAINSGGATLVLEKLVDAGRSGPELCLFYNLRMNMSASKGMERTEEEYRTRLQNTGFNPASLRVHINEGYNCYDAMLCPKL